MSRIDDRFAALAKARRGALIPFVMGGDPSLEATAKLLPELVKAGASLIEIGIPFSDPMADGPVIQAAGLRALAAGATLRKIVALVAGFRKTDKQTPVILMGYYNSVYHYGVDAFCKDASTSGVDGVILVDLPPEEEDEFVTVAGNVGLSLIRLIAPTTDDARFTKLTRNAKGFLYYIAVAGITGGKSADLSSLSKRVAHLKGKTSLPLAVGFGIKTPEQAAAIARFADGVVVGSALVEILHKESLAAGTEFIRSLRSAMDNILSLR